LVYLLEAYEDYKSDGDENGEEGVHGFVFRKIIFSVRENFEENKNSDIEKFWPRTWYGAQKFVTPKGLFIPPLVFFSLFLALVFFSRIFFAFFAPLLINISLVTPHMAYVFKSE
jgi:hypothetical protein